MLSVDWKQPKLNLSNEGFKCQRVAQWKIDQEQYPPSIALVDKGGKYFVKFIYKLDGVYYTDHRDNECLVLKYITDQILDKGLHFSACRFFGYYDVPLDGTCPILNEVTPSNYFKREHSLWPEVRCLIQECIPNALTVTKFDKAKDLPKTDKDYLDILLQVVTCIHLLQIRYRFVHNDLHTDNVFIQVLDQPTNIQIKSPFYDFYLTNVRYIAKITDFEFSFCESVPHLTFNELAAGDSCQSSISYCVSYDCYVFIISMLNLSNISIETKRQLFDLVSLMNREMLLGPYSTDTDEGDDGDSERAVRPGPPSDALSERSENEDDSDNESVSEASVVLSGVEEGEESTESYENILDYESASNSSSDTTTTDGTHYPWDEYPLRFNTDFGRYFDINGGPTPLRVLNSNLFKDYQNATTNVKYQQYIWK